MTLRSVDGDFSVVQSRQFVLLGGICSLRSETKREGTLTAIVQGACKKVEVEALLAVPRQLRRLVSCGFWHHVWLWEFSTHAAGELLGTKTLLSREMLLSL